MELVILITPSTMQERYLHIQIPPTGYEGLMLRSIPAATAS